MSERYFVAHAITGSEARLAGPEAHHLIHVMRARPGTSVVLFDGSGAEFAAVVQEIGRAEVRLSVSSRQQIDRELPRAVTLGVPLPKGDRQRWLVEKAAELGVGRIVPLKTARSVAQPGQQALERLRRTVIEASKQCGRNRLLEIAAPQSWSDFVAASRGIPLRLLAHPSAVDSPLPLGEGPKHSPLPLGEGQGVRAIDFAQGSVLPQPCRPHPNHLPEGEGTDVAPGATAGSSSSAAAQESGQSPICLAIGPEGGFTDEEVAFAVAADWQIVDLGPRILRIETAALLLVAIVAQPATR